NRRNGVEVNFIPDGPIDGVPLIQVLGLDRVNLNSQAVRDGVFDFLANPQMTINPANGRVYFPVLEPFGSDLREALESQELGDTYAFDSLYTTTQANAQFNFPEKNRFTMRGSFQSSSSSDISLNAFNIPQGSVTVTAGGVQLVENQDYTVDYQLGRVKIINQSIMESGQPIDISLESNALFNIQTKTMFGARFDYEVNKNFVLGSTFINLAERPLTQKVNIGDEPINNTVIGFDGSYTTESQFLTSLVDRIPLINTKEISSLTFTGEVARLFPGHSGAIGDDGVTYIDDFEGSQSTIDLRSISTWVLASTPQGQPNLFPEASLPTNNIGLGYNRAKLAWYIIDPLFFLADNGRTPSHIIGDAQQSNHFMRRINENEVFPNRDLQAGVPNNIPMFDLAYYPEEVGPYNYDVDGLEPESGQVVGHGMTPDGNLLRPEERWGGIMRRIETNDFQQANVEFIQFWMMDPYAESADDPDFGAEAQEGDWPDDDTRGELYFNLGTVSEDVLKDGVKSFENGLSVDEAVVSDITDSLSFNVTAWGRTPANQVTIVNAFDNEPASRELQDIGLDGLRD
ncbi:MAG: cell surface protein SprA, partial [Bacteroidota bacterium]